MSDFSLEKFDELNSFAAKRRYADQNLPKIGMGTGRLVYDLGNEKVLKLARNEKGIEQNYTEDRSLNNNDVGAEVFSAAHDHSWIVAEKAKKVNPKRFQEITGVKINDLFYYLRNYESNSKGGKEIFHIDPELKEFMNENDFVQGIVYFIQDNGYSYGDFTKLNSFGEVNRNGKPTIVAIDYGLTNEIYKQYYDPDRKKRVYELVDMNQEDALTNFTDATPKNVMDGGYGGFALIPHGVDDSEYNVDERIIKFVENFNKKPSKPIENINALYEIYKDNKLGFKNAINKTKNKSIYFRNLLFLQEYLQESNFLNEDLVSWDAHSADNDKFVLGINEADRACGTGDVYTIAPAIANFFITQYNSLHEKKFTLTTPKPIGEPGGNGAAFIAGNGIVLKVTIDASEVNASMIIQGAPQPNLVDIYGVYKIMDGDKEYYVILEEQFIDADSAKWYQIMNNIEKITGEGVLDMFVLRMTKGKKVPNPDGGKDIRVRETVDQIKAEIDQKLPVDKYPAEREFADAMFNIIKQLASLGIQSTDYASSSNLGRKRKTKVIGYFDIGANLKQGMSVNIPDNLTMVFCDNKGTQTPLQEKPIAEDGATLYSTDHGTSDTDIPSYAQGIQERVKSYMPNSTTVTVKKKCRLGGSGNTSVACNQGDINNLELKSINEIIESEVQLVSLKSELAQAAQKVYDNWEQDDEGYCDSHGAGGICGDIADAMLDVLYKNDIEATTVSSDHEVHVYVVAKAEDGIFYIDIRPYVYETGGGYCWKKIPDVRFDVSDVIIDRLSSDPNDFENYMVNESKTLNEVGEGNAVPYAVSIVRSDDWYKKYRFITEDNDEYMVEMHETSIETGNWYMIFGVENEDTDFGHMYNVIVNKGKMYKVMATIMKILRGFFINSKPNSITIEPTKENSTDRRRFLLYKVYIKKNLPPDYEMTEDFDEIVIKKKAEVGVEEGVGDKYAERKWGIPDEDTELNRTFLNKTDVRMGEKVGEVDGTDPLGKDFVSPIFKNPKSLKNFESDVRAIADIEGNLYVAQLDQEFNHGDMSRGINLMFKNGIYNNQDKYQLLHRIGNTNSFGLADSSEYYTEINDENKIKGYKILQVAKKLNPQFEFFDVYYENTLHKMPVKVGEIEEGVGDKYLENKYNIEPEFTDFDKQFNTKKNFENKEEVLHANIYGQDITMVKNPKSLRNIGAEVRGVIDDKGNLFVEETTTAIHNVLLRALHDLGIIDYDQYNWHAKYPTNFITVVRLGSSDTFILGESNETMTPDSERGYNRTGIPWSEIPTREQIIPVFQQYLDKANQKNPNINFINDTYAYYRKHEDIKSFNAPNNNKFSVNEVGEKVFNAFNDEVDRLDAKREEYDAKICKNFAEANKKYLEPYLSPEEMKIVYNWVANHFESNDRNSTEKAYDIRDKAWAALKDNDYNSSEEFAKEASKFNQLMQKVSKFYMKQRFALDKKYPTDAKFGMAGEINANEVSHFTTTGGAIGIIRDGYIMENEEGGVSTTTNKNLVKDIKPVFYHPQSSGFEGVTYKNLSTQFVLDLNKIKADGVKVKEGNEHRGTHIGEEEIRIYPKNGELDVFKYLIKVIFDPSKETDKNTQDGLIEDLKSHDIKFYVKGSLKEVSEPIEFEEIDDDLLKEEIKLKEESAHATVTVNLPSGEIVGGFGTFEIKANGKPVGNMEIADRYNKYLILDRIMIDEDRRGEGFASAAIKLLFDYADKQNKIVTLTPDNMWGISKSKLIEWYKSLGFIMNKGKNKDFETMQLMYRAPKNYIQTKITEGEISTLQSLPFNAEIQKLGGKIYSVGGAVRDEFLGKESKDLDILITGVPMDKLIEILNKHGEGRADLVGKSFGVLKYRPKGSTEEIDIAIPRTEKPVNVEEIDKEIVSIKKQMIDVNPTDIEDYNAWVTKLNDRLQLLQRQKVSAGGHKGFEVKSDPDLPIEKDLIRRDFTINAIAKDIDGNVIDPFNGQKDLQDKVIRVVNPEAFSDDPLRMLRAVQFASRFGFRIEPFTMKMIKENAEKIKEIPAERILTELDKILKKGNILIGAQLLHDTGLFKEIFGKSTKLNEEEPWTKVKTMAEFIYLLTKSMSDSSSEFYKSTLKGDIDTYKELKALEMGFEKHESKPAVNRGIAFNMYNTSPVSLDSEILPDDIKIAASELKSGKYPKTMKDLDVDGNDLMNIGLNGKEVGDGIRFLLIKLFNDTVHNNKKELLQALTDRDVLNEKRETFKGATA